MRKDSVTTSRFFWITVVTIAILFVVLTLHMYKNVAALFTDEDDGMVGIYQTAILMIEVEGEIGVDLNVSDFIPGDIIERNLIINNVGSVPFTYSVYLRAPESPLPSLLWTGADGLTFQIVDDGSGTPIGSSVAVNMLDVNDAIPLGTLGVGQSETIRFRLELPVTADNSYQNLQQTITIVFHAVQLAGTIR